MKLPITAAATLLLAATLLTAPAETRTWTNSDGKEINAELARIDGTNAVLTMSGKEYPVAINTLCPDDQEFIKQWQAAQAPADADPDAATSESDSPSGAATSTLIAAMKDNLVILDGRDLVPYQIENADEIDVVAFYSSASWCGPCQAFSPDLCREYKSLKRRYPNFELVLLSSDRNKDDWAEYIQDHKMPFPSLDFDKLNMKGKLAAGSKSGFIPSILIKTADGEVLDDAKAGAQASLEHLKDILKERAKS
jgi:nucleoredoxin